VAFADRFGATVDVETTASDVGYFLVRPPKGVDHARFRAAVAAAVGGLEYIQLESVDGFVVVATQYATAQALRTHPLVEHVGGVEIDPERFPTPTVVVDDRRDGTS
jgi:hypothetical protein